MTTHVLPEHTFTSDMAKLPLVFMLPLLFGTFRPCLLQSPSTDLKSVRLGENVTLPCSITADYEISWYHQSSEEMKLLITAGRQNLDRQFYLSYNVDDDRYDGSENTSSVDLMIKDVNEADSGLYFCGGRNQTSLLHFGRAVRLNFADEDEGLDEEPSPGSPETGPCRILTVSLMCVCFISVLLNITCMWVFCFSVRGKSALSCSCWNNTKTSTNTAGSVEKELEVQYASPVYREDLPEAAEENTASTLESVTYARISRPGRNLPA